MLTILPLIYDYLDIPFQLVQVNKETTKKKYRLSLVIDFYNNPFPEINCNTLSKHKYKNVDISIYQREKDSKIIKPLSDEDITPIKDRMKYFAGVTTFYMSCDDDIFKITEDNIHYLAGVKSLTLYGIPITDIMLQHLIGIHTLKITSCASKITDHGLQYLQGIHTLRLPGNCRITDNGLKYLSGIYSLCVAGKKITNDGMKYLTSLYSLDIYHLELTREGLQYLTNLKELKANRIELCKYLENIEYLDCGDNTFSNCNNINRKYATGLHHLKNIKRFGYLGNDLVDDDLENFKNALEIGISNHNKIYGHGFKYLSKIKILCMRYNDTLIAYYLRRLVGCRFTHKKLGYDCDIIILDYWNDAIPHPVDRSCNEWVLYTKEMIDDMICDTADTMDYFRKLFES